METKSAGFQKILTSAYLLLILAILPVYMKDGFYLLADAKYLFFRNVSWFCAIAWLLGTAIYGVGGRQAHKSRHKGYSVTDWFVIAFGILSVLSYLFSNYKDTALVGYSGWYMGLLTEVFLVGGYFLVSRGYEKDTFVFAIVWISVFLVCLLGVLNRQGYDPLGTFADMDWFDWNRRNLLSTIGNINWYCGYLAVGVPLLLYCFWAGEGWRRIPAGVAAFVGIGGIFLQGSASGYIALAVMYVILFFGSCREVGLFLHFWQTVVLVPLFCFLAWLTQMDLILPYDMEHLMGKIYTPFWGIPLGILTVEIGILWVYHRRKHRNFLEDGRVLKAAVVLAAASVLTGVLLLVGCQVSEEIWGLFGKASFLRLNDDWGSGRGKLWAAAWEGFCESNFVRKLYGVGPDCFACYFYEAGTLELGAAGQWKDAIYANAHNEWLNMLINQGILGGVCYLGIFLTAFWRFSKNFGENRKMMAGMMTVGAYMANQFFSFGQVVATPFIFLVIAVCENECKRIEIGKERPDAGE